MSNIAGKSYAMNVVTPIAASRVWINKFIFWLAGTRYFRPNLLGLITLSLIHYARWVIVKPSQFPRLDPSQPKEDLKYSYMFFFSNFNGSWDQYVDSFSTAIPGGLDLLWYKNIKYPNSVPIQPFHDYITFNQIWTNHYYNAYPMAASNDVKSAKSVKDRLLEFIDETKSASPAEFQRDYNMLLRDLQYDLGQMAPTPIVSLAAASAEQRRGLQQTQRGLRLSRAPLRKK